MRSSISEQLKTAVYRRHEEDDESSAVRVTPRAVCYLHFFGSGNFGTTIFGFWDFFSSLFFFCAAFYLMYLVSLLI